MACLCSRLFCAILRKQGHLKIVCCKASSKTTLTVFRKAETKFHDKKQHQIMQEVARSSCRIVTTVSGGFILTLLWRHEMRTTADAAQRSVASNGPQPTSIVARCALSLSFLEKKSPLDAQISCAGKKWASYVPTRWNKKKVSVRKMGSRLRRHHHPCRS